MTKNNKVKLPSLNFVPRDPFYETAIGKASLWALRVGRYIIIFTEIIVIMSFASRFKLDRDLTDLNSSIVQKSAVVTSYADIENQFRLVQKKSDTITKLITQNKNLNAFYTLIDLIPFDIKIARLGFTAQELQIAGVARSSLAFSLFLQTLQHQSQFANLSIDQIASGDRQDPGITFTLRIKLKEQI